MLRDRLPVSTGDMHVTDVPEDHDAVRHRADTSSTVDECTVDPKLSPVTVTDEPPVWAMLTAKCDPTGLSNVSMFLLVPAMAPIVRNISPMLISTVLPKHSTVVAEVQEAVLQAKLASCVDAVRSVPAKFRPVTVIELPPDKGTLDST